ncbi:uncharacterized protein [Ptychodera flava]|uniref:uncharacterized protein n=1 Tax=Ptychodera flava TaxID=63121 RepID=UPI00396A7235
MFFNGELRHEIVNSKEHGGFNFNNVKDREKCMEDILSKLASSTYEHTCHKDCETRGCGKLYVLDGCWKLQFQHCLFQEEHDKALGITVPDVCTATPEYGKAFCVEHCLIMEKAGHPIRLREFLSAKKPVITTLNADEAWRFSKLYSI